MERNVLANACITLAYLGVVWGQVPNSMATGLVNHSSSSEEGSHPQHNTSSGVDIEALEARVVREVSERLRADFQTCEALKTGLGLETRVRALEHTVAGVVEEGYSGVTAASGEGSGQGKTTAPTTAVPSLECPAGFLEFESHCYLFNMRKATWDAARQDCRIQNADLVSITTFDEQRFLVDNIKNYELSPLFYYSLGKGDNYWLGLLDTPTGRIWVDGTPEDYQEWGNPREPNCMKRACKPFMSHSYVYRWEDAKRSYEFFSICEIDMLNPKR